jgi:hypothetical protein
MGCYKIINIGYVHERTLTKSRPTLLWLLIYGFGMIAFGIFLLVIGSGMRVFLIFTIIGVSLIGLWLYFNERSKNQKMYRGLPNEERCICLICNHEEVKLCLQYRCPCCITMKGDTDIFHSNSLLQ